VLWASSLSRLAASFRSYWYDCARGIRPPISRHPAANAADADERLPALPWVRMVALQAATTVVASSARTTKASTTTVLKTAIAFERWLREGV
jgi:hypothetical protein